MESMEFIWSISGATATIIWSLCGLHLKCHKLVEFYGNSLNTPTALHIDSNGTPKCSEVHQTPEGPCGVYLESVRAPELHVESIWSPPELQRAHVEFIWSLPDSRVPMWSLSGVHQNSGEPIWSPSQLPGLHPNSMESMWSSPPMK